MQRINDAFFKYEQPLAISYVYNYHARETSTVRAEISAVCKFRGFHGHLLIQRKFNP